ncbi:hypothetical protein Mapa_015973 [Marchantia paleacea]|nr:hypothetical protein Mapa_015973 [Marchantia paleacea]
MRTSYSENVTPESYSLIIYPNVFRFISTRMEENDVSFKCKRDELHLSGCCIYVDTGWAFMG